MTTIEKTVSTPTDDGPSRTIIDLATGAWRTQALYTAVRLRLPDHVHAGATDTEALAASTGADPDSLLRLMRLLCHLEIFDGDEHTGFRANAVSEALRDKGEDASLRDLCLLYGEEFYRAWAYADHAVAGDQQVFTHAVGAELGTYLAGSPDAARRFQRAMNAGSVFFDHLPDALGITGGTTVVDIGGGSGHLLGVLLSAAPEAHGVLVDLEHMMPVGRAHLEEMVDLDRVRFAPGDIFSSIPSGGDVYMLSRVLQDWDDEACLQLLHNCRAAMGPDSRLVIVERVIDDDGGATLPLLWDLHLLVVSGGRERTMSGYRSLLERAGLRVDGVADLPLETTAIVAVAA